MWVVWVRLSFLAGCANMTAKFTWGVVDDGLAVRLRLTRFETLHETVARFRRAWNKCFAIVEVAFFPVCDKTPRIRITVFRWKLNYSRIVICYGGFASRAEVIARFTVPIRDTRAFGGRLAHLLAQVESGYVVPG